MEEDTPNISGELVRRTGLLFLPNIGANLREFLASLELPEDDWESLCAEHIALCCISCGKVVEGVGLASWLLAIGAGESRPTGGLDFVRLRSGCCASTSCNGRFYNVVFKPHADIDWHGVSTSVLEGKEEETAPSMVGIASEAAKESVAKQVTKKSVILLGVLLALWLFKHWYTGGEIPIIQPAKNYTGEFPGDSALPPEPDN